MKVSLGSYHIISRQYSDVNSKRKENVGKGVSPMASHLLEAGFSKIALSHQA